MQLDKPKNQKSQSRQIDITMKHQSKDTEKSAGKDVEKLECSFIDLYEQEIVQSVGKMVWKTSKNLNMQFFYESKHIPTRAEKCTFK